MSKKYNQDDSPESEFKRMVDEFSTTADSMTREFDQKNGQAEESLVDDSEDDEEDKATFKLWSQIGSRMLSVFPLLYRFTIAGVQKTVAGAKKAASFGYFWGQKAIALPRHLVSLFPRRKNNTEGGEELAQNTPPALTNPNPASAKPATKTATPNPKLAAATSKPAAPAPKVAVASPVDRIDDDEFDDENRKLSWSKLGFKVTSAAAIALLVTSGYFGVKSFLGKSEVTPVEEKVVQTSEQSAVENPLPENPLSDDPFATPSTAADKVAAEAETKPPLEEQPTDLAAKKSDLKKEDAKKEIAANSKEAAPKTEPKTEPKPKETAKTESAAPVVDPFAELANFTSEKPKSTPPETAMNNPWGLDTNASNTPTPATSEKNNSFASTDLAPTTPEPPTAFAALPEKSPTLDEPTAAASPLAANTESSSMPAPTSGSLLDSFTSPSPSPADPAPAITAVAPLKETKPSPATDLAPLKLTNELAASPLEPLKMSATEETKPLNEQALTIPKTNDGIQSVAPESAFSEPAPKTASNRSAGRSANFSKAPTPPELTSPIAPPTVEPPAPVVVTKQDEIVPVIPSSGTVQHFAVSPPPAPASMPTQPSLSIPKDSVIFNDPAPKPAETTSATKKAADYTPPILGKDAQIVPKTNASTSAMSQDSVTPFTAPAPVPAIPVPAILPQHEELAKVEPPLGSQLQKQVQEIRSQENSGSEPRLRFGSDSNAKTGAVRYHPKATIEQAPAQPLPMPMPIEPNNPESNPLAGLLPNGDIKPGIENSLPPLTEAPKPDYAAPNLPYRRLGNQNLPASTQPETMLSSTNNANRASLFRQRLQEEIKRSPASTEQYTVKANDTYLTISDHFFGTGKLFRALAEYNRQKYGIDYKLVEGTIIEIPTADYLKTNFAEAFSRGQSRPENNTTNNLPNNSTKNSTPPLTVNYASMYPAQPQGFRYTVQEGDTVFRIATNQLRDSSRWQEIMRLNTAQLHDPRDLQPGMEIVLPANVTQTALR